MNRLVLSLIAALTLGLAPYLPEPHIWKQIVNISRGAFAEPVDWFDLALHGAPWMWFVFEAGRAIRTRNTGGKVT